MEPLRDDPEADDRETTSLTRKPLPTVRARAGASISSAPCRLGQHCFPLHESSSNGEDNDHTHPVMNTSTKNVAKSNPEVAVTPVHEPCSPTARSFWETVSAWMTEIMCCVMSCLVFGMIVVVLSHAKDKRVPKWCAGLTVNTVIALLSTLCRAMTIIPVSEGISQLKWNWLARGKRPLRDLDVFDQASRGPLGSILMVYTARGQMYAVVAAIILITGLATSTMTQAAVSIDEKLIPDVNGNATTYLLNDLDIDSLDSSFEAINSELTRVTLQSIMGPLEGDWPPHPEPICTTSECQWRPFESLGVCSTMRNATEHLKVTKKDHSRENDTSEERDPLDTLPLRTYEVSLLNNTSLTYTVSAEIEDQYGDALANITALSDNHGLPKVVAFSKDAALFKQPSGSWPKQRKTATFQDDHNLLNATFAQLQIVYGYKSISSQSEVDRVFRAAEMLWHFCVQEIDVKVQEGTANTRVLQSHTEVAGVEPVGLNRREESIPPADEVLMHFTNANNTKNFSVLWPANFPDVIYAINEPLVPPTWENDGTGFHGFFETKITKDVTFLPKDFVDKPDKDRDLSRWKVIEQTGKAVARGMTNTLRDRGEVHSGDALITVPFIRVTWAWLAFLATQIVLTWIFLIIVIVDTSRLGIEVVKSSQAASLFALNHDFSSTQYSQGDDSTSIIKPGLRKEAERDIRGKLDYNNDSWTVDVDRREKSSGFKLSFLHGNTVRRARQAFRQ